MPPPICPYPGAITASFRITPACAGNRLERLILFFPSVIQLGKAALAGFPEAVIQIDAGLPHGAAHHVVADVPGAGEKIAQIAGVHGADCGDGVALDAGDLRRNKQWITQKSPCGFTRSGAARSKSPARCPARPRTICPWPTPPALPSPAWKFRRMWISPTP